MLFLFLSVIRHSGSLGGSDEVIEKSKLTYGCSIKALTKWAMQDESTNHRGETMGDGCRMSSEAITGSDMDPLDEKNSTSGQTMRDRRLSGCMLSVNGLALIEGRREWA